MNAPPLLQTLSELVVGAGEILLHYFGRIRSVRQKEHPSSVVCDADLAAEKYVIKRLHTWFPRDGIVAEESGILNGSSGQTWVIDPLDGTSNFVAGIPWFGVQIGVLRHTAPIASAMYLPVDRTLYLCALAKGVTRNGRRMKMSQERTLRNTLCAFGFDPTAEPKRSRHNTELLRRVSSGVRNIRATNSLVDFCYTLEGRFGGCINLNTKVWDIVPASLMLSEAGGKFTDLRGKPIRFLLDQPGHSYEILGASRPLHARLLDCLSHA